MTFLKPFPESVEHKLGKKVKCCNQPKYSGTFRNWVNQNQIYENAKKIYQIWEYVGSLQALIKHMHT